MSLQNRNRINQSNKPAITINNHNNGQNHQNNTQPDHNNTQSNQDNLVNRPSSQINNQPDQCPLGCCEEGDLLCISIPCPVQIVLLGTPLTLELPCLRLSSNEDVTPEQLNRVIQFVSEMLSNLNIPSNSE